MKCSYSKWPSIALIAAIYIFAALIGIITYFAVDSLMILDFTATNQPLLGLFAADVVATIVVWAFGLLYENVSVYDPYWSVFPPVTYLLWAFHTGVWSLPVILLLVASWYWGWRLTRNWAITFKGIAHEDWRYTKYRSLHPALFHLINFFGLNMVPTLVVFAAMLPGLKLYEWSIVNGQLSIINCQLSIIAFWQSVSSFACLPLLSSSLPTSRAMISAPRIPAKYVMWDYGSTAVIRTISVRSSSGGEYGSCMPHLTASIGLSLVRLP